MADSTFDNGADQAADAVADAAKAAARTAKQAVAAASETLEGTTETARAVAEESQDAIKSRFSKAIDEARASADTLRANAAELTVAARKVAGATAGELTEQATALAAQSRDRSLDLVRQGKVKTSEAIAVVGRAISDTAPVIDEKLGVTYGDYARSAAGALENSADKLAAKDIAELGDDVKAFVRKSPATALGLAAVTGFLLARLFGRSDRGDA